MLQTGKIVSVIFNDDNYVDKVELNLGDYEIIEEHGKTYAVKKKKEYPKTYEECCYVLGFENTEMIFEDYYRDINPPEEQWKRLGLMNKLNKLLICRDAYWKIAGEEMGLGKPWEPDWLDDTTFKYVIANPNNYQTKGGLGYKTRAFAFPTEEMRDAFKENFDPDIEICKELL